LPEKKVSPKLPQKKVLPKKSKPLKTKPLKTDAIKTKSKKPTPKSWQLIAAVVAGVLLVGSGIGVGAFQVYTQTQLSAALKAENAIAAGSQRIEDVTERLSELELAVQSAMEVEVGSQGRTLDEKDRDALIQEIEKAKETWVELKTKLLNLENAVDALKRLQAPDGTFTDNVEPLIVEIKKASEGNWQLIVTRVSTLEKLVGNVQTAQASWQQEQDRIAAEESAAKVAAIERALREASAREVTDTTALAAPPASSQPVVDSSTPTAGMLAVQTYILALATNVTILWDPDLCEVGFVCGRALPAPANNPLDFFYASMGWTGAPTTSEHAHVFILLDSSFDDFYASTDVGRYILVHEAAHARQWLTFGKDIVSASEAQTESGLTGVPAIEYMADCATIVKLGYSMGAYTSTCSGAELSAAATIW
jgi:hypothetical protein